MSSRLTKVPGIHAFLGYALFFPSIIVGPSFDFNLYNSFVNGNLFLDPPTSAPEPAGKPISNETPASGTSVKGDDDIAGAVASFKPPKGRKRVAYVHMGVGVGFLAAYALLGSKATYEGILREEWKTYSLPFKYVLWSLLVMIYSFLIYLIMRFLYVQAAGLIARLKYYAVWELTDGAMILCGLGFNGYDPKTGRTRWNRVRNIDIVRIETAENYKLLFDHWNMRTSSTCRLF